MDMFHEIPRAQEKPRLVTGGRCQARWLAAVLSASLLVGACGDDEDDFSDLTPENQGLQVPAR